MRIVVEFIALLVLAQMWNLLAGYAGLVSIGQQAYVGPRRLRADRARRRSRREPVPRRSRWPGWSRRRSRCPPRRSSSASAAATSRWAPGRSPRSTGCSSPTRGALGPRHRPHAEGGVPAGARDARAGDLRPGRWPSAWRALVAVYAFLRSRYGLGLMAVRDSERGVRDARAWTSSAPSSASTSLVAFGTGVTGALIYLNLLRISPDAALQHQLDGLHDLHRGDRRARHARGPAVGTAALLPGARAPRPTTAPGT